MYMMEKTLDFKSGSIESGKQEVWGKKAREIEFTGELESDRGKKVLCFWWTQQNLIWVKNAHRRKMTAENNVIKWTSAGHGKCLKMAFTKREMERKQNIPLCLKATYRKLLRAKKRKERTLCDHPIYLYWELFGDKVISSFVAMPHTLDQSKTKSFSPYETYFQSFWFWRKFFRLWLFL